MSSVYKRGDSQFWWVAFVDARGKRCAYSTRVTDRAAAERMLAKALRVVEGEKAAGVKPAQGPLTFAAYFETWLKRRREAGVSSVDDDETRVRLHALPSIGSMPIAEIRPRHMKDLITKLEKTDLAPRSVLHVYATCRVVFADALMRDLIQQTPCILSQRRGELPKKRDKDARWRVAAVFTRSEVEALISDTRIEERRRVIYACEFLAGLRANELTPRRWTDYDTAAEPLGKLTVATAYDIKRKVEKDTTKTGVTREIPVHPTLAKVLAKWRLSGWAAFYGRPPQPNDLIVPGAFGADKFLSSTSSLKRLHEDLDLLGFRRRRQHDARRTFISLGLADGASKDKLRWITHTPADVMDLYTTLPWATLCGEVSKLHVQLREGELVSLDAQRYGSTTAR